MREGECGEELEKKTLDVRRMDEFWRRKREEGDKGRKTTGSICREVGGEGGENTGITTLERGSANQRPGSSGRP